MAKYLKLDNEEIIVAMSLQDFMGRIIHKTYETMSAHDADVATINNTINSVKTNLQEQIDNLTGVDSSTLATITSISDYLTTHKSQYTALLEELGKKVNLTDYNAKIEEITTKITTDDGTTLQSAKDYASEILNTYITNHTEITSALQNDIEELQDQLGYQVNEEDNSVQLVEIVQIKSRVKTIEDDYLKSSDKTELKGEIDKKVTQVDGSSLVPDSKVTSYDEHIANNDIHVTSDDKKKWDGKQDAITAYTAAEITALYNSVEGE